MSHTYEAYFNALLSGAEEKARARKFLTDDNTVAAYRLAQVDLAHDVCRDIFRVLDQNRDRLSALSVNPAFLASYLMLAVNAVANRAVLESLATTRDTEYLLSVQDDMLIQLTLFASGADMAEWHRTLHVVQAKLRALQK